MSGMVYLVGAGPGDPGLITVRGREVLQRAEVVIYDRLVNERLLAEAPAACERIYAGKQAGQSALTQDEIVALLIEHARAGRTVVRLKGGDPFVFGRGGEEAEALAAAGLAFEIIPGVTAGIAAPAFAGIPLTHRDLASSVAFVTGHEDPAKEEPGIDWAHLATATDTLVIFMGVEKLAHLTEELRRHGRAPTTPAAVIRWGTLPAQTTVIGTLADIAERCQAVDLQPPALLVVGEVVSLRARLNWFEAKPLRGRRLVITRARDQAAELIAQLQALGAEVIACPLIRIEPLAEAPEADAAIARLHEVDWLVFTSINGVQCFERRLPDDATREQFRRMQIGAIGPSTAASLRELGCGTVTMADRYIAEGLVEKLGPLVAGQRVLVPQAAATREVVRVGLEAAGAHVEVVPVYRTVAETGAVTRLVPQLERGEIDLITFASGSAVQQFVRALGERRLREWSGRLRAFCLGPATAEAARTAGLTVVGTAEAHSVPGLVAALVRWADEQNA